MPRANFLVETPIKKTARAIQVASLFDLDLSLNNRREWDCYLPLEELSWKIGAVVGPSGSGKTQLIRHLWGAHLLGEFSWSKDKCILDDFPRELSIKSCCELLNGIGFSSPPAWMRPFHCLSNGEQWRVTMARALSESRSLLVVDEFTSIVDRTVAKIGSAALSKIIRRGGSQFIVSSCHYDIIDWLAPDWVMDMGTGQFLPRGYLQRPPIELEISACSRDAWEKFRAHHYLNTALSKSAKCFEACWQGRAVAFVAVLPFPHPRRTGWIEHRLVCLPDYQGVGIGNRLSEFIAGSYVGAYNRPYFSSTSHPGVIRHRTRSPLWRITRVSSFTAALGPASKRRSSTRNRLTTGFEYVGPICARADQDRLSLR